MPPALDRAPRRPRRRPRPNPQTLRDIALSAPARPLNRTAKPPRVTQIRHSGVRASHFIPGEAETTRVKPLQSTPPKRPVGQRPRGVRQARQKQLERTARNIVAPTPKKTEQRQHSFVHNLLSARSPVGQSVREGRINPISVGSTIAGRIGANVLKVVAQDPGKQLPLLLKDTGESIVSIPAGIVRTVTDPKDAAKSMVSDYDRRYKSLLEGDDKAFQARMKKEGVAPEVFDLASVATAEGGIAGRALQKAAEAGTLGKTAARVATTRPGLRVSGGLVKQQPVSDNFFRNVVRAGVDTARSSKQARRAGSPEASALVREAADAGEVTPIFRTGGMQRRAVAQAKGRQLASMKAEQQAQVGASTRAIRSLSKPEQKAFKYAMQYGITTPQAAREVLEAHRLRVGGERHELYARTGQVIPPRQNEVPEIEFLIANADKAFTPRLAKVAAQERARGVLTAAGDPGVALEQAEVRRVTPLAELLKVKRGVIPDRAMYHGTPVGPDVILKEGLRGAAPNDLVTGPDPHGVYVARSPAIALMHGKHLYRTRESALRDARDDPAGLGARLTPHDLPPDVLEYLGEIRHGSNSRRYRELVADVERKAESVASRQAHESAAQFVKRVETEAAKHGLSTPGYFPSEKRGEGVFSAFAVGGRQAVKGPGEYTGALTRTGRENTALDVLPRGLARNIKRKYNWNLVADNFDRHAYSWSKDKTIDQLKDEMERRGIDPGSVAFWNPKKFRDQREAAAELEGPDAEAGNVTPEVADAHEAAQLATNPAAFKDSTGWSLIPKSVHDEILTDIRPSGLGGRVTNVAVGKVSRYLLAQPAWLQFQVGSNALLTGLSGAGPVDAVKAQVWWRKLSDEQKHAIEPYIGVQKWYDEQTHLGATVGKLPGPAQSLVQAWQGFKQTRFYRHPLSPRPGNVLDTLFKADNAQNNFFRKAVFYNKAKREAYKRMGSEAGKIITLQDRAMHILSLPPKAQMEAAIKDADTFERIAEHTNNFLGDYSTYTTKERRTLGRLVMFYGFLRYSVKFTLYTMPIEHPLVSSILAQVGRLERDEQKRIFGADVPGWELGNLYTKSGRRYQLSRLSPFFNAIQYGEPGSLTSSVSPLIQVALNQVASKDVTFDKPFTVGGSGQYVEKGTEIGHPLTALVPGSTRNKIALEQLLRVSPYYRIAEKTGIPGVAPPLRGKQTSESGLLWPDPVRYKQTTKQSREAAARNEQTKRDQAAGGVRRQLLEQLLPLAGQQGQDTIRKAREFDEAERKKKSKKRKKKSSGPPDLLGGGPSVQLPNLLGP